MTLIIYRMCSIFCFEAYKQETNFQLQNICVPVFVEWLHLSLFSKQKTTLIMKRQQPAFSLMNKNFKTN